MGEELVPAAQQPAPQAPPAAAPLNVLARAQDKGQLEASLEIEVQRAAQEVNVKVLAARSMPRDMTKVKDRIKKECEDIGLAEISGYKFDKGDGVASGPSIHLAVMVARCFGNCRWTLSEHRNPGDERPTAEWEAGCWDQETGGESVIRFTVEPRNYTSGKTLTKPRDVAENARSVGRRNLRNCIQDIVGRPLLYWAWELCKETLRKNTGDIGVAKAKMIATFAETFKVTSAQIEKYLDKSVADMDVEDILNLRTVFATLRDGQAKVEDLFDPPAAAPPAEKKGKGSKKEQEAAAPDPKSEKSTTQNQSDSSTGTADASPKSGAASAESKQAADTSASSAQQENTDPKASTGQTATAADAVAQTKADATAQTAPATGATAPAPKQASLEELFA